MSVLRSKVKQEVYDVCTLYWDDDWRKIAKIKGVRKFGNGGNSLIHCCFSNRATWYN